MTESKKICHDVAGVLPAEFAERVNRARALAAERELDALIVVGRGGGPFERHANLLYLTGHYSTFPAIPDHRPHWQLRGYGAAVVTPDRLILLSDDDPAPDEVHADELVDTIDLPASLAEVVAAQRLGGRRIGLVGSDVLSAHHVRILEQAIGSLVPADDLLNELRMVKSPAEQQLLRRAGVVGAAAISAAIEAAGAGATELEAAAEATRVAVGHGAAVANVFTGVSGGPRPRRRHPYPSYADDAPITSGDVFSIDMSGALDGYFFDFSRSRVIGDDRHGAQATLTIAQRIVDTTVDALRAGTTIAEASARGFAVMDEHGDDLTAGRFDALGHGLGLGFEDPWLTTDNQTLLQPGMCIAVEKYIHRGPIGLTFEQNVLVTDGAPEVISVAPRDW
jgi:Xaa-Pro aminopeptidase